MNLRIWKILILQGENQNLGDKEIGKVGKFMNVNGELFDNQLFSVREDVQVRCSFGSRKYPAQILILNPILWTLVNTKVIRAHPTLLKKAQIKNVHWPKTYTIFLLSKPLQLELYFEAAFSKSIHFKTKALRKYYKKNKGFNNADKLRYCHIAAKRIVPLVALSFVSLYWITGLTLYYFPNMSTLHQEK